MAYVLWRVFMKKYSKVRLGIRNLPVIPADRRPPEKEETWTLPTNQQDSCVFDDTINSKPTEAQDCEKTQLKSTTEAISVDTGDNVDNILPRSQETRKSKTKKVKSYLRKCKGALSKGDESVTEKKRQENCTSWYLEDIAVRAPQEDHDEPAERYTEFPEERLEETTRDTEPVEDLVPDTLFLRNENLEETPDEAFIGLLEEDRRIDLGRSGTPLCEDARGASSEQHASNQKTPSRKPEQFCDEEKKNMVLLETLTAEDTNLDKCDSNDTLIAEIPEAAETATNFNLGLTVEEGENARKTLAEGVDEDAVLAVLTSCAGNEAVVPEGWPLTLGGSGLILQLGELEASALRLGECYLCVRSAAAATTTATTTSSVSGATTAVEAAEQNTVESFHDLQKLHNYLH